MNRKIERNLNKNEMLSQLMELTHNSSLKPETKKLIDKTIKSTSFNKKNAFNIIKDLYDTYCIVKEPAQNKNPVTYCNGLLKLADIQKRLYKISNREGERNEHFLFYYENFIKDIKSADQNVREMFVSTVRDGNLTLCKKDGQSGIKLLNHIQNYQCNLVVNSKTIAKATINYELKIHDADRIGIICLKPDNEGPELFVAVNYVKNGFHNKQHNSKEINSENLKIDSTACAVKNMKNFGLFSNSTVPADRRDNNAVNSATLVPKQNHY